MLDMFYIVGGILKVRLLTLKVEKFAGWFLMSIQKLSFLDFHPP